MSNDRRVFVLALIVAACRQPAPVVDSAVTSAAEVPSRVSAVAPSRRAPGECDTLLDVEKPDTLRVLEGGVALYASEQVGLAVVDVSDSDRPRLKGTVPLVGEPAGVFELRGFGVLVATPSAEPGVVAIRVVSLDPVRELRAITLAGRIRDVRRVGDLLVVTRTTNDGLTAVTSFGVDEKGLMQRDEVILEGRAAATGATPRGLAVARNVSGARVAVTWIALDPDVGALATRGTVTFHGTIPIERPSRSVLDVTEDDRARLVTTEPAAYAALDFTHPSEPHLTVWNQLPGAGVIGFQGTRLVVARPTSDRSDASELAFYRSEEGLIPIARVRVRGTVGSIVVRDSGDVISVGWTGSASAGKRAIVHHIDARDRPRLVGATTFGGDWTWSRAYDDDRAVAFDPLSTLAALPMTTVRGSAGPQRAAEVLSFEPDGPRALAEAPLSLADRLVFVNGRLLAFSADGVVVIRHEGETGTEHPWR